MSFLLEENINTLKIIAKALLNSVFLVGVSEIKCSWLSGIMKFTIGTLDWTCSMGTAKTYAKFCNIKYN